MKYTIILIFFISCNLINTEYSEYKNQIKFFQNILDKNNFVDSTKEFISSLSKMISPNNIDYQRVLKLKLINEDSYIHFKSPFCISLVTRKKKNSDGSFKFMY